MVWIDSWTVDTQNALGAENPSVEAQSFLIDRYEVTNEQFKRFVDHGGYEDRKHWRESYLVKEGQEVTWEQAMAEFVGKTGRPGPATWQDGTYSEGKGNHPVSGVSWFEADAYATFSGKHLPTIHHWQKAACMSDSIVIIPFSNFELSGTATVGSYKGMGRSGLYDMAGNAKEWCWNAVDDTESRRYILGGSWGEQSYMFTETDFRSPWNRAATNGFRCVRYSEDREEVADVLFKPLLRSAQTRDYSTARPCSDEEYRIVKQRFDYDQIPLDPIVESVDDNSPFWRHEKIKFNAAYDGERMIGHLFVPKGIEPPYQVVVYWPSSDSLRQRPFVGLPEGNVTEIIIMSGRALLFPIYKGSFERGTGQLPDWDKESHAVTEWIIQCCKDMRRSIDYLMTREDIQKDKMAYYGMSAGGAFGPMALAIENRFKTGILLVGGFPTENLNPAKNSIDPLNHAPRVKIPVLMINGKEDHVFPYETSQRPMYDSMGTLEKLKAHRVYPGGHGLMGLFMQQIRKDVVEWLDRYLGPVN
jgi:dienelactone hydrolase